MLKFIANLFGKKPETPVAPAPYKVEASTAKVSEFPFPEAKAVKKPAVKKPAVKAKAVRKPRAPKV